MARVDWFANEELFREELEAGHQAAEEVARRIEAAGIPVSVTPLRLRDSIEERYEFADEFDLLVGERHPCKVDVKSRRLAFTGPADYPYPTAFVDTVSGWEAKGSKPVAVVLVSRLSGGLAVIGLSTREHWSIVRRFDHVRRIEDRFYAVPRERLRSFESFTDYLKERERGTLRSTRT